MENNTLENRARGLLKVYVKLKNYELLDSAFDYIRYRFDHDDLSVVHCVEYMENEKRCLELAKKRWDTKRRNVDGLIRVMEEALSRFCRCYDERYCSVLISSYFSKNAIIKGPKELADDLDMSVSSLYSLRRCAEERYVAILIKLANELNMDLERVCDLMDFMERCHESGGILFTDSLKVLKRYRSVKYISVENRIYESMEGKPYEGLINIDRSDILTRWMRSSMMENTYAVILLIDETVRRMNHLGKDGKVYSQMIRVLFLDRKTADLTAEEKMKKLGMTTRVFYVNRTRAITMFSEILWGFTGYRNHRSQSFRPFI